MIVKNPTDAQVGPYQFKDDTYGPIPAQDQISGVPDNVAYWMRDSIHNFLVVLPEAKVVSVPKVEAPKVEKTEEVSQLSQSPITEVKTEAPKVEKPKAK